MNYFLRLEEATGVKQCDWEAVYLSVCNVKRITVECSRFQFASESREAFSIRGELGSMYYPCRDKLLKSAGYLGISTFLSVQQSTIVDLSTAATAAVAIAITSIPLSNHTQAYQCRPTLLKKNYMHVRTNDTYALASVLLPKADNASSASP